MDATGSSACGLEPEEWILGMPTVSVSIAFVANFHVPAPKNPMAAVHLCLVSRYWHFLLQISIPPIPEPIFR